VLTVVAFVTQLRGGRYATGRELLSAWLAGIPQYVIAGLLGGGAGVAWAAEHSLFTGLIGVLVLVAAITLAVDGEYPAASSITSSA
jgi:hypothetical protein